MTHSANPIGLLLDPPQVDAGWMQSALVGGGAVPPGSQLNAVRFETYLGTGQLGRSARFALDWAQPGVGPATVVAKIPGMQPEVTGPLFDSGMYDAEIAFYNDVASRVDTSLARCFHAFGAREELLFIVLMEDLADYQAGDQLSGIAIDDVHLAIEQAAMFHGPLWGDPTIEQIEFFRARGDAERAAANIEAFRACVPLALTRLDGRLSDGAIDTVQRVGAALDRLLAADTGTPLTVTHGDFRPDNFLFSRTNPQRPIIVVDWQTMGHGLGAADVAYLLGGALEADARHDVEADLLTEYLGLLRGRYGLVAYDEAQLRRDYARGTIAGVIVAVTATVKALRTARGDDLFTLMIERHAAHVREYGILDTVR